MQKQTTIFTISTDNEQTREKFSVSHSKFALIIQFRINWNPHNFHSLNFICSHCECRISHFLFVSNNSRNFFPRRKFRKKTNCNPRMLNLNSIYDNLIKIIKNIQKTQKKIIGKTQLHKVPGPGTLKRVPQRCRQVLQSSADPAMRSKCFFKLNQC